jgi:hypothetical protein
MPKYWKDKKKEKSYQRRKGFKPPFNIKNHKKNQQEQSAKDESKKDDSLGKRGILMQEHHQHQASQCGSQKTARQVPEQILKFLWNCCAILNEVIKKERTCIM